jgi:DNA-directed RNA polymerase subunit RPC12/RpoP
MTNDDEYITEVDRAVHHTPTGLLYTIFKRRQIRCDVCGYLDKSRNKDVVQKRNDGIYRCAKCQDAIESPEPGMEWWRWK